MNAVTASGLSKTFRRETSRTDIFSSLVKFLSGRAPRRRMSVLSDISFELPAGRTLAVCGPNGSGKTTLLRVLAGILRPCGGTFTIQGKTACILGFSSIIQDKLTVEENARFCSTFFDIPGAAGTNAPLLMAEAGLSELRNVRMGELSAGMRIRLPFIAALNSRASVFLVDEALAVGDAAFQKKCLDKFSGLKAAGAAVVLATHNLAFAEKMADEVLLLEGGRQTFIGPFRGVPGRPGAPE